MMLRYRHLRTSRTHIAALLASRLCIRTTHTPYMRHDPTEQEREQQLREMVLQKFRGMTTPAATHHTYGHFANTHSTGLFMGASEANTCEQDRSRPDWLMLFTGIALVYVSGKLLFMRARRDVSEVDIPLWVASPEVQAKHFVYCAQFPPIVRDEMRRSFQTIRENNPFVNFYTWLPSQQPFFGVGRRHSFHEAMNAIVETLRRGDQLSYLGLAYAFRNALAQSDSDPRNRLDSFVDALQSGMSLSRYVSPPLSSLPAAAAPGATMPIAQPGPAPYLPSDLHNTVNPYVAQQYSGNDMRSGLSGDDNIHRKDVQNKLEYALNATPDETHGSVPFAQNNNTTNTYQS